MQMKPILLEKTRIMMEPRQKKSQKNKEVDMNVDFRIPDGNTNVQREPLVKRRFAHCRLQHSDDEGENNKIQINAILNFYSIYWIYFGSSSFFDI